MPEYMDDTEHRLLEHDIDRTREALIRRHPAFMAHERFMVDRLNELAHRAYQHGRSAAVLELRTTDDAVDELGVTRAWVNRMAARHEIGWKTGRVRLFMPGDIEELRQIIKTNRRGPKPARERDDE